MENRTTQSFPRRERGLDSFKRTMRRSARRARGGGALSAVLSNIMFGQGPWTPFQMFSWGLIGFLAATASPILKKSKLALALYGVFSGVIFSLLMDGFSVLWAEGTFSLSRYGAFVVAALPVTAIYAVSNVIFLLALSVSMGEKLERITKKYGI